FLAAANSSAVQAVFDPVITHVQNMLSPADDALTANEAPAVVGSGFSSLSSLDIVPAATTFSAGERHSLAVKDDGTLWSWGANTSGATGFGITEDWQLTPAQVGTATNWTQVSAGGWHSLALRSDGTLWAWGDSGNGQTGLGGSGRQTTPAQVGTATNWTQVSAGQIHSLAIRQDGTLWSWGNHSNGRTGLGTTAGRQLTPAQVGTATNWTQVSAGTEYSLAIRQDGTLWSWGNNGNGRTGLGTTAGNQLTPAQVGTATNWTQTSAGEAHSLAIRADGTLWAWGSNSLGRTGLDTTTTNQTTPAQVGTATNWAQVSAARNHSLAIKADGTLWAWGQNAEGRTGLGVASGNQTTPAQVGTATDWLLADAAVVGEAGSGAYSLGMRTDGTLWGWGRNADGQLGLNDTTQRTVPTLIGSGFETGLEPPDGDAAVIATLPATDATDITESNTTHISIFFDKEMNPAVMGTVALTNRAAVNLSQAEWRASTATDPGGDRGNNSVLTVPLILFASDTLHQVVVSGFRCVANDEPMTAHNWTFTTGTVIPPAPSEIDIAITKNLQMPVGTITPDTEFAFDITAYSFNNETDQADFLPTIAVSNITFSASDVATVTGDVRTVTKVSDVLLGNSVIFPSPGLFTYRISERTDTFSNTTTETMTFDLSVYQVTFIVLPDFDAGTNYVSAILVQEVLPGDVLGSKLEDLETALTFTNTFVRNVEIDPTDPLATGGLRISKTTTGIMPDFTRAFDFDVRLSSPSLATTITPPIIYRAQIIDTLTNETIGSVIEFTDEVTRTVALTHNQTLVFLDTHVGTRYTAVELPVSDYTPHVIVHTDGVVDTSIINPPERTVNVSLSTGEQTLGEAANTADFTNTDFFVPPTGLDIGNFGMALLLMAIAGLIVLVSATRRSKREMELAVLTQ
ncbi:MAG: hypothetical protein FWF11_02060, partial [Coriobacteriia bacterium]|nr:hypothetical protein [Coriobacteriia bacterium]